MKIYVIYNRWEEYPIEGVEGPAYLTLDEAIKGVKAIYKDCLNVPDFKKWCEKWDDDRIVEYYIGEVVLTISEENKKTLKVLDSSIVKAHT